MTSIGKLEDIVTQLEAPSPATKWSVRQEQATYLRTINEQFDLIARGAQTETNSFYVAFILSSKL